MNEETVEIEIPLLLPEIEDGSDDCVVRLQDSLRGHDGISHVHVRHDTDPPALCLHFNPNLVSLADVHRLARQAGSDFTNRYRHERVPFRDRGRADAALSLTHKLAGLPGMLHASVNHAAGLAFVAYDTTILQPETIARIMLDFGVQPLDWPDTQPAATGHEGHTGHDHGSAPAFLPHWAQERWTLLLVGLTGLLLLAGWLGTTLFGMPPRWALGLFLLSYLTGGYDIATHAIPGLFKGKFDTDVLMLAAALGAAILGKWLEGAFLLFLFSLGHAGEHYALDRARNAVNALGEMMPRTARVKQDGKLIERPVEELQIGDVVLVRPGDRVPVDGLITMGDSALDQSPVTGESVPVPKSLGDEVFAGTINQDAALEVEVSRLARDNTLNRVMQMVAEAQSQQSPTQQFTTQFTRWFVPSVLIFVLAAVVVPPLAGWMPLRESFYRGMLLLVAASPCALALGTPASVLAGIARAARNGVLIKGGVHLENLGSLKAIAFDKTGTLTEGLFALTDILPHGNTTADDLLRTAGAVEQGSSHPLALAVTKAAQQKELTLPLVHNLENIAGRGVRANLSDISVQIGSLRLFREMAGLQLPEGIASSVEAVESQGKTAMIVRHGELFLGVLALADTPRPRVQHVLRALQKMGIGKLVMLTGDNSEVAERIGAEVGVTDVRAGLLPEDKLQAIRALNTEYGAIAMVGDGVNDAPALATATVGIAMGGAGTAVALETADVALMADDLGKLPFAVGLSRASRNVIRQNLAVSLAVIALLIVTSVFGWLELSWAVVLHEGSSLVVVANALRLLRYTQPEEQS